MTIRLRNSLTRRVEPFTPLDPDHVRVYLCGPTVYDRAHLGNARNVILFDVLTRLLRHDHPRVTYVRNVTDVDDKINARAAETGRPIREITDETLRWYHEDMEALGNLPPDHEPRATEWIDRMIEMTAALIAKGHAYEAQGHVLFAVATDPDYGSLSNRSTDDMFAGARVEVAPYKRDPMDFVLWKPSTEAEPGWDSPWGRGRPGWHIECSAMARELLGERFDIHGGGVDLMFPHHENEIAQSRCAHGSVMAQVWLHNEMLLVEGRKMSKSLGNFFTVRDLLDQGVPGEVIRYVFLSTHYSKPMDWTEAKAKEAETLLHRHLARVASADLSAARDLSASPSLLGALRDDLNTHAALSALHDATPDQLARDLVFLGLYDWDSLKNRLGAASDAAAGLDAWADRLTEARVAAIETKDFAAVDSIKAQLTAAGVEIRMTRTDIQLSPGPDFDATKLEGAE
ncbi:cysteine--tRNA ligase [Jannaschia aquimarina]|uniref:Cysteine--tRNA ligase n=1 Tax=Jannaschia aquimarina TaxID=935700 RepID=A0A0D1EH81_9RHOB|nr:cysteine--tRNA ligase [Jannaschia aquimarina]KIT15200.1 Cysteine--tRNA ligase [Jannaschia aquimarina]SNT33004.1 cysteinyl-tRNA synthetase [Jannaschia aquimarina]